MSAGPAGVRAVVACAVLGGMLGIGAPAGAGTDDTTSGDERGGPEQGVTYSGRVDGFRTKLTAIAPTVGGDMTVLVKLRLECGDVRGQSAVDEQRTITIGPDGSYSVEVHTNEEGGGERRVDIELSGRFDEQGTTTARFSYDLFDEDDDGNTDACKEKGELDLEGGRASRGLQRVEVAIPIEPDDRSRGGRSITTTTDAVFLSLDDPAFAESESMELFRIDPSTNEVVAHNTAPVDVDTLVVAGASLFAIDAYAGTLAPVDSTTLVLGAPVQVAAPALGTNDDFALYPGGATIDGSLWLSATRDSELVRIDPSTGAVAGRVPLDGHPAEINASATSLYVETQTAPIFGSGPGSRPTTNVIRRIDPASGQVVATSPAYQDGSIGATVASADGVAMNVTAIGGTDPDQMIVLDPETLEVRETAPLEYPLVAAAPGFWTERGSMLRALRPDLTREIDVPYILPEPGYAGAGFDAVWVYSDEQHTVFRVSTSP